MDGIEESNHENNENNKLSFPDRDTKSDEENSIFWQIVNQNYELPVYIKNIIKINYLNAPLVFKTVNETTLNELENFVQNGMIDILEPGADLKLYFGPYYQNPDKFRFLIGIRSSLLRLATVFLEKPDDFWLR